MRDWLLVIGPLGLVVFFLIYPGAFTALVAWLA